MCRERWMIHFLSELAMIYGVYWWSHSFTFHRLVSANCWGELVRSVRHADRWFYSPELRAPGNAGSLYRWRWTTRMWISCLVWRMLAGRVPEPELGEQAVEPDLALSADIWAEPESSDRMSTWWKAFQINLFQRRPDFEHCLQSAEGTDFTWKWEEEEEVDEEQTYPIYSEGATQSRKVGVQMIRMKIPRNISGDRFWVIIRPKNMK